MGENPRIKKVWLDFCCTPQLERTHDEALVHLELKHVCLLYLGLQTLVLFGPSYATRFWTRLEFFLASQCIEHGLRPAEDFITQCIPVLPLWQTAGVAKAAVMGNVVASTQTAGQDDYTEDWEELVSVLGRSSVAEVVESLSDPQIAVSCSEDRIVQLGKLLQLKDNIESLLAD